MELLELKSIWEKATAQEGTGENLTPQQVQLVIKKRSNTAISKIKREMKFKIWFLGFMGALCMIFAPVLFFLEKEELPLSSILEPLEVCIIYFSMGAVIFIFSRQIKSTHDKIVHYQKTSSDLKTSINGIIKLMHKIMKLAVTIGGVMTPLLITWIVFAFLYKDTAFSFDIRILYVLIIAFICHKLFSFLEARIQNKKYGKYVDALKQCLHELETDHADEENNIDN